MNTCPLTIGIITYNEEHNILKFFDSLKAQQLIDKFTIAEVIFVDDSNDETPNLINKIKAENPEYNIRLIHNDQRKRQYHCTIRCRHRNRRELYL